MAVTKADVDAMVVKDSYHLNHLDPDKHESVASIAQQEIHDARHALGNDPSLYSDYIRGMQGGQLTGYTLNEVNFYNSASATPGTIGTPQDNKDLYPTFSEDDKKELHSKWSDDRTSEIKTFDNGSSRGLHYDSNHKVDAINETDANGFSRKLRMVNGAWVQGPVSGQWDKAADPTGADAPPTGSPVKPGADPLAALFPPGAGPPDAPVKPGANPLAALLGPPTGAPGSPGAADAPLTGAPGSPNTGADAPPPGAPGSPGTGADAPPPGTPGSQRRHAHPPGAPGSPGTGADAPPTGAPGSPGTGADAPPAGAPGSPGTGADAPPTGAPGSPGTGADAPPTGAPGSPGAVAPDASAADPSTGVPIAPPDDSYENSPLASFGGVLTPDQDFKGGYNPHQTVVRGTTEVKDDKNPDTITSYNANGFTLSMRPNGDWYMHNDNGGAFVKVDGDSIRMDENDGTVKYNASDDFAGGQHTLGITDSSLFGS
jgi:hypothetical protein